MNAAWPVKGLENNTYAHRENGSLALRTRYRRRCPAKVSRTPDRSSSESETALWRLALVILVVLAVGFAAISWGQLRNLADGRQALPIGLVVLVVLFVLYALGKTREMDELRGLVRGLETARHRAA